MRNNFIRSAGRPRLFAVLAASLVLAFAGLQMRPAPIWEFRFPPEQQAATSAADPFFRTVLDLRGQGRTLHSPAVLGGTSPAIIWFEGSREAARDVRVMSVALSGEPLVSGRPEPLLGPEQAGRSMQPRQALLVLGNTIAAEPGRSDRLLSTVVSVGGWAAASVAEVRFSQGRAVMARKLALSPFLNRSHLVRNATARFSDGDSAVPAYLELGNAFGVLVRLAPDGRVRAISRIGHGQTAIQPSLVVTGPDTALAFMRPFDGSQNLKRAHTRDGGKTWSAPIGLADVPNPNAPVSVLRLEDGRLLMAFNDSSERADNLTLAVSSDGGTSWKRLVQVEQAGRESPGIYRYPDLARLPDGTFLLSYSTFAKGGIRAHHFNLAWLVSHE